MMNEKGNEKYKQKGSSEEMGRGGQNKCGPNKSE